MELQLIAAGVLVLGYIGFKVLGSSGLKLPAFQKKLAARKPPSPEKFHIERVTLDITPVNLLEFIRKTATLRGLNFRLVADFTMETWPDTYFRAFVHETKPLYALIVERIGLPIHVEFLSLFDDLTTLLTSGSEEQADPARPAALTLQLLPGFTMDELYIQHLSALDNQSKNCRVPSRQTFFEDFRASLIIDHETRHAKHVLRCETLQGILQALPPLNVKDLIRRYDQGEPLPLIPVPAEVLATTIDSKQSHILEGRVPPLAKPQRESLLERRKQAIQKDEDDAIVLELTDSDLEQPQLAETPDLAAEENETIELDMPDMLDEPIMAAITELEAPEPTIEPSDSPALLPFQIVAETPEPPSEATPSTKPTCPHCGATLFSTLSSRCSKCKQSIR